MSDPSNPTLSVAMTAAQWAAVHAVMRRSVGVWDEITPVIKAWEDAYRVGVDAYQAEQDGAS